MHLFFLYQGLGKLGKAYVIGCQARRFESLELDTATYEIERIARNSRHDLGKLIALISVTIPELRSCLEDPMLKLLEDAYFEGCYPRPTQKSIFKKYGMAAVVTTQNQEKVFKMGRVLLDAIQKEFGVSGFAEDGHLRTTVAPEKWERFARAFKAPTREEQRQSIRKEIEKAVSSVRSSSALRPQFLNAVR